jgi:polysaccharide biosynthesis/export protein
MKYLMLFLVLVMAAVTGACATGAPKADANKTVTVADPPTGDEDAYIVQPGDILEIQVWKERDLQREVLVRPDGGFSFPLIDDVQASNKTVEQLRKELTTRLSKFIPNPSVTVITKQATGNRIYVVGKVHKPGEYLASRGITVMQALSMAGGTTPFASPNRIKILRRVNGTETAIPFKYSQVSRGKNLEQDIVLQSGDVVVVP